MAGSEEQRRESLDKLTLALQAIQLRERDVKGFINYRELVERGLVEDLFVAASEPEIKQIGNTLEIGRRSVRITRPADFDLKGPWLPVLLP